MVDAAWSARRAMTVDVSHVCALAPARRFDALGSSPNGLADDAVAERRAGTARTSLKRPARVRGRVP